MAQILEKNNSYVVVKYSIEEYDSINENIDHNLYLYDKEDYILNKKLDDALKIDKKLLFNI